MIVVERGFINTLKNKNLFNSTAPNYEDSYAYLEEYQILNVIDQIINRTEQSYLNMELKDIEGILNIKGKALIGLAEASGLEKAQQAIEEATRITETQLAGITKPAQALLGIITGKQAEFSVEEFYTIIDHLQNLVGEQGEIIYGYGEDQQLHNKIRVFVVFPI